MSDIASDNMGGAAGDGELDEMIVGLVWEIGSPVEVDPPLTMRDEDVEKFGPPEADSRERLNKSHRASTSSIEAYKVMGSHRGAFLKREVRC